MTDKLGLDRLDSLTVPMGCTGCSLLAECGGFTRVGGGWSCHSLCRDCDPSRCDKVCFNNPNFASDYREVGGFEFRDIGPIRQTRLYSSLPRYIPVIYHGSSREAPADLPWVVIPLEKTLRRIKSKPIVRFRSKSDLFTFFKVNPSTRILFSGVGLDSDIEALWRGRHSISLVDSIRTLGAEGVITPNHSLSLAHPRTQHLHNRKRILIWAQEFSSKKVAAIPMPQALTTQDFEFWFEFLVSHPEVNVVCQEFQTGLRSPARGLKFIESISDMQCRLDRPLHFLAVGGFQYHATLRDSFDTWTVVDSTPFIKAQKRQRAWQTTGGKMKWRRAGDASVDELLQYNVDQVQDFLDRQPSGPATRSTTGLSSSKSLEHP